MATTTPWLPEVTAAQFVSSVTLRGRGDSDHENFGDGSSMVGAPGGSAVAAVEAALARSEGLQWVLARSQTQSSDSSTLLLPPQMMLRTRLHLPCTGALLFAYSKCLQPKTVQYVSSLLPSQCSCDCSHVPCTGVLVHCCTFPCTSTSTHIFRHAPSLEIADAMFRAGRIGQRFGSMHQTHDHVRIALCDLWSVRSLTLHPADCSTSIINPAFKPSTTGKFSAHMRSSTEGEVEDIACQYYPSLATLACEVHATHET